MLYTCRGITIKERGMARYMAKSVPGMDVPESLIDRLKGPGQARRLMRGQDCC
jgi:methylenetetrahydrofolate reductase (NADPH)